MCCVELVGLVGAQATIVVWEDEEPTTAHAPSDSSLSLQSFELLFNEEKHQVLTYLRLGTTISNYIGY